MTRRPRKENALDDVVNPNTPYDPESGTGKDPHMSGPRENESTDAPLGYDPSNLRESGPRHRADASDAAEPRPWQTTVARE